MRNLIISLAFLALASAAVAENDTDNSSEGPLSWEEMYQSSEWVLRIHIEGVGQLVNPAMSRNYLMAIQGYRYSASVLQSWKGEQQGTIRFQVALADCPQILQVDSEYIVFGSSDVYGMLETDSCEKIVALDNADGLLPQLEKFLADS